MDNWQRNLAYGTGCLVIGLAVVVFTHVFIELADRPGFTGYFTLFAFGIGFFSLCFAMNRRFMLKSDRHIALNYCFSFLIVAPTLFWAFTRVPELADNTTVVANWDNTLLVFTLVVLFAAFLGTYSGSRYGVAKRDDYLSRMHDDEEELPDDLKRPHDEISKN